MFRDEGGAARDRQATASGGGPGSAAEDLPLAEGRGRKRAAGDDAILHLDAVWDEVAGLDPDHPLSVRLVNFTVALGAVVAFLPLGLLIALAIKLDSPGPVFYRQLRVGLDRRSLGGRAGGRAADPRRTSDLGGRLFVMYKFRTMHSDAEEETGPVWASREDGRTTRVGRFLRRFRLDEIPQFWNVLKGDMAVVGPRPERPSFVQRLREEFGEYQLRHRVPPGITGWAQVHREPDQSLDDVQVKLQYDLEYLRRRSLAFDLRIMLRTLPVMMEGEVEEKERPTRKRSVFSRA